MRAIQSHHTPYIQEPIAFVSGFIVGILDLNIKEDPLRTWIVTEAGTQVGWGGLGSLQQVLRGCTCSRHQPAVTTTTQAAPPHVQQTADRDTPSTLRST